MFSVCNTWVIYRCMMQLVGSIMQYLNYTLLTDFVILKNETHFILDFTDLVMKLLCLSVVSLPTTPSPPTPSFPTTKHTYTPKIPTYISIPQHFPSPPPPIHTPTHPTRSQPTSPSPSLPFHILTSTYLCCLYTLHPLQHPHMCPLYPPTCSFTQDNTRSFPAVLINTTHQHIHRLRIYSLSIILFHL